MKMTEENKNPFDLVDKADEKTLTAKVNEKSWQFFENLIQKIAKLLWMPDPKTWAKFLDTNTDNPAQGKSATENKTLEQDISNQSDEKKEEKFSFDNIMSGVSDVLGKIGKKVEEKTWIDLNNPLKKKDETINNEEWNSEKLVNDDEAWKETQKDAA